MAVARRLVLALGVLMLVVACSSDDDDDAASQSTETTAEVGRSAPIPSPPPESSPVSAAPTPPPTALVAETGVPGLDSDDSFCAAWSRFGGSWQVLVQAGAAGDPARAARLEVIASSLVGEAYDDVFAAWPAELEPERDVVADAYFGAFQRRSDDAASALGDAGATDEDVAQLAAAWDMALQQYDPAGALIAVDVPPELEPVVLDAAEIFSGQRVPFQEDPSMVITAETPMTDAFLATACPDQGWIVGQDVVEGGGGV